MKKLWINLSSTDIRNIIAVVFVLGVLIYIYVLVFKPVPPENKDLVNVLGGTVISSLGIVLGYYFGASKASASSNRKQESSDDGKA